MATKEITADEFVNEMQKETRKPSTGLTTQELAARMGRSVDYVRFLVLAPAKRQGRLIVERVWREGLDGRNRMFTTYRFKEKK